MLVVDYYPGDKVNKIVAKLQELGVMVQTQYLAHPTPCRTKLRLKIFIYNERELFMCKGVLYG